MPPLDLSGIRNKIVRGQLLAKHKKDKAHAKLKKRIANKEAVARGEHVEKGWTRTIENTKEWLGDSEEWSDPRTRPAKVEVDEETGDVKVDLGSLATLFPAAKASTSAEGQEERPEGELEPKLLITTSPGKPPSPLTKDFCDDLQQLLGGKMRADIVPRRSPKFELGKVARWARGRGYGAIAVVGEDHQKPTTLTLSLLPNGPTAHFRLTGVTLGKDIKGHAKPTSHPPELVLNHFSTPLGLSLASLLSHLFLPPSSASTLEAQGYAGRQVVLAQNSRDFVFIRRYRYMFALKSHRVGNQKKKRTELEELGVYEGKDEEDDVVKTRFQEMGPRMTLKMRWIRRGGLGETGDERVQREKEEKEAGVEATFGDVEVGEDGELGGKGGGAQEGEDERDEREAARAIGIVDGDEASQPNFDFAGTAEAMEVDAPAAGPSASTSKTTSDKPVKRPRKRSKPYHALLRPPPSPSPEPGFQDSEPIPLPSKDGKKKEKSLLSTVGKTWHAGKGEGGVREARKRQEWGWEAKMQVSRRKFFL